MQEFTHLRWNLHHKKDKASSSLWPLTGSFPKILNSVVVWVLESSPSTEECAMLLEKLFTCKDKHYIQYPLLVYKRVTHVLIDRFQGQVYNAELEASK